MKRAGLAALICAAWLAGCVRIPDAAHPAPATDDSDGPITVATPLAEVVRKRGVRPLDPAAATPLLDQAMVELAKTDPSGRNRGVTYSLTKDNRLGPDWLVQTPNVWGRAAASVRFFPLQCEGDCEPDFRLPACLHDADCGGDGAVCGHLHAVRARPWLAGRGLCLGHSDAVLDRFYQVVADARQAVDITLLEPAPDTRWLAALRNAVTQLARTRRHVTVRVLIGQYPPTGADAQALLQELVRDARSVPGDRVTVYAAAMQSCGGTPDCASFSWNHAKIVAVDGRTALVGGHNLWTEDYLLDQPVHDISMQLRGGAAADAHGFADALWEFVCDHAGRTGSVSSFVYRGGATDVRPGCRERIALPSGPASAAGGVPVLASARLGSGITTDFADQDDLARDLIFGAARHDILAAQQDIGFILPGTSAPLYPEQTLKTWAEFLLAGRGDVFLVLSNAGAEGKSKGGYSNGIAIEAVAVKLLAAAQAASQLPASALVDLVCRHFHLAPLRFGPDATWPNAIPIAQHSKFWMVDDRYFYIGSDNLYPVDLQEFGYIVDDRSAAADLRRQYWDPLWRWSRAAAVSGDDAPRCVLRKSAANAAGPAADKTARNPAGG